MDRRSFIKGASAGLGMGVMAGCTSSISGAQPEQAEQHIESARDTLLRNEETFDNIEQRMERGDFPSNFEAGDVRTRVNRAHDSLDEAEQYATEDQLSIISALRDWGSFQLERAEYFETAVRLINKLDTVTAYFENQQYQQAKEALDKTRDIHSELVSSFEETKNAYSAIDRESLESGGVQAYEDEIQNFFTDSENWHELIEGTLDGFEPLIDGFSAFFDAANAFDAENYETAAELFGDAQVYFAESERALRRLEDNTTDFPAMEADLVRILCLAGALEEGSGLWRDSARAAADGNFEEANELAEEAAQVMEQCGSA